MAQHDAAFWIGWILGALGGSLLVGAGLGLIPLVLGIHLNQAKFGRIAFLWSVVAGFFGGVLAAVPVSIGFVIAIIMRRRRGKQNEEESTATNDA